MVKASTEIPFTSVATHAALIGALSAGCGSGGEPLRDASPGRTGTPPLGRDAGGVHDADFGAAVSVCGASARIVYLLDEKGVLRRFDPTRAAASAFQTVGQTHCALAGGIGWAGAGNMTVNKSGVAWVTDVVGNMFTVNTTDAMCKPTTFQAGQSGFSKVGMTFVGNADGTETLYVVDNVNGPISVAGKGLAKIDLATLVLTPIANFDGVLQGRVAELAGTSDGHLYGFFPGVDSWMAEIDPSSGHILSSAPVGVSLTAPGPTHVDTAVSLFGGVFYTYVANTAIAPFSDVSAFDPVARTTSLAFPQIGFNVLGAGVADCAQPASPE
jgi:hypothetical protein